MVCTKCLEDTNSMKGGLCNSCEALTMEGHFHCKECGKAYHSSMTSATLLPELCYKCNFWTEKVLLAKDPEFLSVRIDGSHYQPGLAFFRGGHGGTYFDIAMDDGRQFGTRNLWGQGTIPERFKDRLPDNAKFCEVECAPESFIPSANG